MTQFNLYFNQISNICIWLQKNTKIVPNIMYDMGEGEMHLDLKESTGNPIYAYTLEGINLKSEERVNLEMKRIIEFLLNLKNETHEK